MLKKYLIVFFISMVPLIELRGAIPYAIGYNLPILPSYIIAIIGNMLPVPIIYLFARRVLEFGKDKKYIGKFFTWCLKKGEAGGKKLQAKAGKGLYWALFIFVGIPLPGTGAWTGTLAASILDMDFKKSVIAVMAGVILAGIIMGILSLGIFKGILG
ncbi:MAG: small multi-drug export protein [Bacilli bacterium]|nr:small multi-drug export protein [bacterium]MDD6941310.1 small multi-drug export protein [bacterium]MDY2697410.1 small multi-drug export protein [Bacilli bacterium]MDY5992670.1 small multi-drug export protein [Bacilli bacterium]MEE0015578.1 small multi-drug export protein [Bacilli bacterium]